MSLPTDAKARKEIPIFSGLMAYFPDALAEVSKVSYHGNAQHNGPGAPLTWDRSKSQDDADAAARHLLERAAGVVFDSDKMRQLAKAAWRTLAALQKELEAAQRQSDLPK